MAAGGVRHDLRRAQARIQSYLKAMEKEKASMRRSERNVLDVVEKHLQQGREHDARRWCSTLVDQRGHVETMTHTINFLRINNTRLQQVGTAQELQSVVLGIACGLGRVNQVDHLASVKEVIRGLLALFPTLAEEYSGSVSSATHNHDVDNVDVLKQLEVEHVLERARAKLALK